MTQAVVDTDLAVRQRGANHRYIIHCQLSPRCAFQDNPPPFYMALLSPAKSKPEVTVFFVLQLDVCNCSQEARFSIISVNHSSKITTNTNRYRKSLSIKELSLLTKNRVRGKNYHTIETPSYPRPHENIWKYLNWKVACCVFHVMFFHQAWQILSGMLSYCEHGVSDLYHEVEMPTMNSLMFSWFLVALYCVKFYI